MVLISHLMKKNVLLSVASAVCLFFCLLIAISFLISSAALIHWHINPEFYSNYSLIDSSLQSNPYRSTFSYVFQESWVIEGQKEINAFTLDNIKAPSLYMLYLQVSAISFLFILILREFLKIISSVRKIQSFRFNNIISFRKIGKYFFILFLLISFRIVIVEQGAFYGLYLYVTPLILMLIAYIFGEIFKEGNKLFEENQFTV